MLAEQESQIYKYFVELARDCDLVKVMRNLSRKDPVVNNMMSNIVFENDYRHNNRVILFHLIKIESGAVFYRFIEALRENKYNDLANKLERKNPGPPDAPHRIPLLSFMMVVFMKFFPVMM